MNASAPHECSSGCKACQTLVAEIDFLRTRIAELENASAAGDEPMQTDDDDVVILEALPPPATAAAVSNAAAAKKKYSCDQCSKSFENAYAFQTHLSTHKTAPIKKKFKCEWPGCTNKTGFASAKTLNEHTRLIHRGKAKKIKCSECGKMIAYGKRVRHMNTHTGKNHVVCTLCNVRCSNAAILRGHNEKFAYEHLCMVNGNKYSCALDDHLAGSSDKQAAERQYDQMRSLFSHHADRHSSVYVLLESLPNATSSRSFKTFVSQIFYAGSTEARDNRAQSHAGGFQSPNKIKKLREIWAAGGAVYMLELGGLAREEAKIAESAVIDAFGVRNLTNERRGLSYAEGKNFADERRSFAQLGTHILTLLHAEALKDKQRVLQPHD